MYVRILIINYDMQWAKNWGKFKYTLGKPKISKFKKYIHNFLMKMHNLSKRYTFIYDLRM